METILSHFNPLHLFLAYMGMLIHVLMKLGELSKDKDFTLKSYIAKNIYTMIASLVMIPVLLIAASDTSLSEVMPINKVTAIFAGWQTQSIFKSLMNMYQARVTKYTNEGQA